KISAAAIVQLHVVTRICSDPKICTRFSVSPLLWEFNMKRKQRWCSSFVLSRRLW
ncbi:unnamed protein product, partial [Tenebrio molitor]